MPFFGRCYHRVVYTPMKPRSQRRLPNSRFPGFMCSKCFSTRMFDHLFSVQVSPGQSPGRGIALPGGWCCGGGAWKPGRPAWPERTAGAWNRDQYWLGLSRGCILMGFGFGYSRNSIVAIERFNIRFCCDVHNSDR